MSALEELQVRQTAADRLARTARTRAPRVARRHRVAERLRRVADRLDG